jgi:hypothetical protein
MYVHMNGKYIEVFTIKLADTDVVSKGGNVMLHVGASYIIGVC